MYRVLLGKWKLLLIGRMELNEINGDYVFEFQNASMRLYGGAQYHRAMAEFRFVAGHVKCPVVSREEIVNACGVEDIHDGTNYFRYILCADNSI
jgi:hypothetical protein